MIPQTWVLGPLRHDLLNRLYPPLEGYYLVLRVPQTRVPKKRTQTLLHLDGCQQAMRCLGPHKEIPTYGLNRLLQTSKHVPAKDDADDEAD